MLLALAIGLLVVQGILAPVFTTFFGLERSGPATLPLVLLVFASAFSFYFGGMAASYKAPSRHLLHGVMVVPAAFVLASALNLALGKGLFPGVEGTSTLLLVLVFLLASLAASYVGSRRGARNLRPQPASRTTPTEEISISAFQPVSISGLSVTIVDRPSRCLVASRVRGWTPLRTLLLKC